MRSILSKQDRKSTEGQYLEELEGYNNLFLAFRLGKCFIICRKCYCSIMCMGKLSINVVPRAVHENSNFPEPQPTVVFTSKQQIFFMPQGGLCLREKLLQSAGRCLVHSAIKGKAPSKGSVAWVTPKMPILSGCHNGRTTSCPYRVNGVSLHSATAKEPEESNKANSGVQKLLMILLKCGNSHHLCCCGSSVGQISYVCCAEVPLLCLPWLCFYTSVLKVKTVTLTTLLLFCMT